MSEIYKKRSIVKITELKNVLSTKCTNNLTQRKRRYLYDFETEFTGDR